MVLAIGQYLGISCITCIGGRQAYKDVNKLEQGVQVVVGTPGRILHLIDDKALIMDKIKIFCLDEADEMLDSTFKNQVMDSKFSLLLLTCNY